MRAMLLAGSLVGVTDGAWAPAAHATNNPTLNSTMLVGRRPFELAALRSKSGPLPSLRTADDMPLETSGPPPISGEDPDPRIGKGLGQRIDGSRGDYSSNWSGQVLVGPTFTAVGGSWAVPATVPAATADFAVLP